MIKVTIDELCPVKYKRRIMLNKDFFSDDAQMLNAIIKTANDGIIIINHRGIIESANPAAATLFDYSIEEMMGQNVSFLASFPHNKHHDNYLKNYLSTGTKKIIGKGREVNGQKKDGSLFPLRLSVSEVKLGDRIIFTGILHDLTQEKEQEEKIRKLNLALEERVEERTLELEKAVNRLLTINKALKHEVKERKNAEKDLLRKEQETRSALLKERELSEMKSRFVTMASHEFRTPLSSILASAELLEAYKTTQQQDKREKNVKRIKNAVNHLIGVLNEFLSLSRLEENSIKPNSVSFHFDDFAQLLIESMRGVLKKGQKIEFKGLGNQQNVHLDKAFLNHVLTNLLSNASKYSKEDQVIKFLTTIESNALILIIKDDGIGIPSQDQVHLFTRFFRAHNVENIPGTGLGLNIVKKYVDLMNGKIEFNSELGNGTTFIVHFPLPLI